MSNLDYRYIEELISQIREGDSNAFAELFAATYQSQYSFACAYLGNAYLAQEALQETYAFALKNINKLREASLVITWLNQINLTACLKLKAKNDDKKSGASGDRATDPMRRAVTIDGREYLIQAVLRLPFTESQTILLKYLCGMKLKQIAEYTDTSKREARQTLNRALSRLKRFCYPGEGGAK